MGLQFNVEPILHSWLLLFCIGPWAVSSFLLSGPVASRCCGLPGCPTVSYLLAISNWILASQPSKPSILSRADSLVLCSFLFVSNPHHLDAIFPYPLFPYNAIFHSVSLFSVPVRGAIFLPYPYFPYGALSLSFDFPYSMSLFPPVSCLLPICMLYYFLLANVVIN
ncbi:MAG: hypothetical protein ACI90V_009745 [Bacillariaceae sp.]|jgi:hypothetical protein